MIDFENEDRIVSLLSSDIDHLERLVRDEKESLAKSERDMEHAHKAQEILQLVAQAVQQKAHEKIAGVVSSCLTAVFGDDAYEFKIEFERKRGRTEAVLRFSRRGLCVDPLTASGGGVVDVAAFALRAACLMLHRPRLSRLLVLDEPFRFVSAEYQPNIRSMLEQLSKDLNLQIIQVTHLENLAIGKVVEL